MPNQITIEEKNDKEWNENTFGGKILEYHTMKITIYALGASTLTTQNKAYEFFTIQNLSYDPKIIEKDVELTDFISNWETL